MMRSIESRWPLIGLLLLLAGCGGGGSGSSVSSGAPNPPTGWTLWFSPGVSLGSGPSFSFPTWTSASCPGPTGFNQTCPSVQYLVNATGALTGKTISVSFTIAGSNPAWNFLNIQNDGNTGPAAGCTTPASVRFYFQQAGDNWSGSGAYAFYRWWSTQSVPLQLGTYTLTVPLNSSAGWSSVQDGTAAANPGPFNAALANANTIGMTFGGGCASGHGVDLLSGSASFKVNNFTVQ